MLEVAIIGGGPAALTAALYLARAGKKVAVFTSTQPGGQLTQIAKIENYPGFQGSGQELADIMRHQVESAGVEIQYGECKAVRRGADNDFVLTIDDEEVTTRGLLVATGTIPRQLKLELKCPVSYCTLCDGPLTQGKRVAVVGGGNSAFHSAIHLAQIAGSVDIIARSTVKAHQTLRDQLSKFKNTKVFEHTPTTATLLDSYDRVFVAIGSCPATKWLKGLRRETILDKKIPLVGLEVEREYALLDRDGYIITGGRKVSEHATEIPGLYAAGDVRSNVVRQVVTAAGDGATAATEMIEWFNH